MKQNDFYKNKTQMRYDCNLLSPQTLVQLKLKSLITSECNRKSVLYSSLHNVLYYFWQSG